MKKLALAIALLLAVRAMCADDGPGPNGDERAPDLRVATFNIENYPKSQRQIVGAFDILRELQPAAVGVQEITRPAMFARDARVALGPTWAFAHCRDCQVQRVGVLFDSARLRLLSTTTHRDTEAYAKAKPAFEARLQDQTDGRIVRILVVHLKAGGDHAETRKRQLRGLRRVVDRVRRHGEPVILLGDFNATGDADRLQLARLADATGLQWVTRSLSCTSYWARDDGCLGTALDHIFSTNPLLSVAARGPCESVGCRPGASCPRFHGDVSDHCPVTAELP